MTQAEFDKLMASMPIQEEVESIPMEEPLSLIRNQFNFEFSKVVLPETILEIIDELESLTGDFNPVELYEIDNPELVKTDLLEKIKVNPNYNPEFSYTNSCKKFTAILEKNGHTLESISLELKKLKNDLKGFEPSNNMMRLIRVSLIKKIEDDYATLNIYKGLLSKDESLIKLGLTQKYPSKVSANLLKAANSLYDISIGKGTLTMTEETGQLEDIVHTLSPVHISIEELKELRKTDPSKAKYYYDAWQIKDAFNWILERYYSFYKTKLNKDFPEHLKYKFLISDEVESIDVRDKSSTGSTICISPTKVTQAYRLLMLLSHEIESHCRQSINGAVLFRLGGSKLKVDDEVLYEGLAKDTEDRVSKDIFGHINNPPTPYYTYAVDMANSGKSFSEVFASMKNLISKSKEIKKYKEGDQRETYLCKRAYNFTKRVFRGHIDTSNKNSYAMPKDLAYLKGWLVQKQLRAKGLEHLNEMAVSQLQALPLLARLNISKESLPLPFLNITKDYYYEVMVKDLDITMPDR